MTTDSIKLGIIGSENFYVDDFINNCPKDLELYALLIRKKNYKTRIDKNNNLHCNIIHKKNYLTWLNPFLWFKLRKYMKEIDNKVDGHVLFYLTPYFMLFITMGIIKKPIFYLCFGGDIYKKGLRKFFIKKTLNKIRFVIVEYDKQKKYIIDNFNLPIEKIKTEFIVWSMNPVYKRFEKNKLDEIKNKLSITEENVIFSPRATTSVYNHNLLIHGLALLNKEQKRDILLFFTGFGDNNYRKNLIQLCQDNNINALDLGKVLTPPEMAEIYNISLINVNIPKYDQFGISIIEGALCGSIPLLADYIPIYKEYCKDMVNCVYTSTEIKDIANKISKIIEKGNSFQDEIYKNNLKLFEKRTDKIGNFKKFLDFIKSELTNK